MSEGRPGRWVEERRAARRLALDVLYESEIRNMTPLEAYRERDRLGWTVGAAESESPVPPEEVSPAVLAYALTLVAGVEEHGVELDALIVGHADHWALDRMPVIDRSLLRMAIFELKWGEDVPVAVAINEAVELAKSLSTDDSGRFVNGLLGRIAEEERPQPRGGGGSPT